MSQAKLISVFCIIFLIATPFQSQAAGKSKSKPMQASKERLVLMPLRLGEEDQKLQGAMETALVEGLQRQYEVLSGEQVASKAREIFKKESKNTAHKECDETRCLQGITEAFQAELLAIASVTKQDGGYFLALSIRNLYDNVDVYSKSLPCEGCNAFQAVTKIKELVGTHAVNTEETQPQLNLNDPDAALWAEAEKGNSLEDLRVYLTTYPKGKYVALAQARVKKLKDMVLAGILEQELQAWTMAQQGKGAEGYTRYLKSYPKGRYAGLAKVRIEKIQKELALQAQSSTAKAPPAQPECVFVNSSDPAPNWVCDEPVEGYADSAVGSAFKADISDTNELPLFQSALLSASVQMAQRRHVKVEASPAAQGASVDSVNASTTKQITSENFGPNIQVQSMSKQSIEINEKDAVQNKVSTLVSKFVMNHPCSYIMKGFAERSGDGAAEVVDRVSSEKGENCSINDVVKELSHAGFDVVRSIKSPQGDQYLLLGQREGK